MYLAYIQKMIESSRRQDASAMQRFFIWLVAGVVAVPVMTVLHELGHYFTSRAFGFPSVVLHYSSVRDANFDQFWALVHTGNLVAAASLYPVWKVAIVAIAGPVVSLAIIFTAALFATRGACNPFIVGIGTSAAVRFFVPMATGMVLLLRWAAHNPGLLLANVDEYNFALASRTLPVLAVFLSSLAALVGLYFLVLQTRRKVGIMPIVSMSAGIAIGFGLYMTWIGPYFLP